MLSCIQNEIELSYNKDQLERLQFYKNLVSVDKKVKIPGRTGLQKTSEDNDFKYTRKEEYHFDEHDFGYSVSGDDVIRRDSFIDEVEEELDFIKALKAIYIGNNDLYFGPADLRSFEEELVLCDYGISDLNGLQYCINVTSLNLSKNNISSIYEIKYLSEFKELFISNNRVPDIDYLKNLSSLEIIDLSDNEIADIGVLLLLDNLKFVDIRNNPLEPGAVDALLDKKDLYVAY
jgi:Leucine-rich repeat (LRR) protein